MVEWVEVENREGVSKRREGNMGEKERREGEIKRWEGERVDHNVK